MIQEPLKDRIHSIISQKKSDEILLKQNAKGRQIGKDNPEGDCGEILKGRIKVDWHE